MPQFKFTIMCDVQFTSGKFAGADEIAQELQDAIENSNPGSMTVNEGEYEVSDWNVEQEQLPTHKQLKKVARRQKRIFKSACCDADVVLGAQNQWWCTGCFQDVQPPSTTGPAEPRR